MFFTAPAFSQLSETDLNKMRLVVKEEVEKAIEASEKRMKEYVSQEIAKEIRPVNTKIAEMDKRLMGDIETLENRLNNIFMLVLALLGVIAVVFGVPQIIVAMQRKDIHAQNEKIKTLQSQIEILQADKMDMDKSELPGLTD